MYANSTSEGSSRNDAAYNRPSASVRLGLAEPLVVQLDEAGQSAFVLHFDSSHDEQIDVLFVGSKNQ